MELPSNINRRIKLHVFGKKRLFFAIVQPGFENTAKNELASLGFDPLHIKTIEGGLEFVCNMKDVWKIHLAARTITRILLRIDKFKAVFFNKLCESTSLIPWELYVYPGMKVDLKISCSHSKLYHTGRISEEFANAIHKRLNSIYNDKFIDDTKSGTYPEIYVRISNDVCSVSIDCTGEALYKRNFRIYTETAPIRETLAAAMLLESDAFSYDALIDPMCGSGVIPLEMSLMSHGIIAGMKRSFAFENFPGFTDKSYLHLKKTLQEEYEKNKSGIRIYAGDIDQKAVETTRKNFEHSGLEIDARCIDFFQMTSDLCDGQKTIIVANPPYGGRINAGNVSSFYRKLGMKLKNDFQGCSFAIIIPGLEAEKAFGLSYRKKILFYNGGIPVSLLMGDN